MNERTRELSKQAADYANTYSDVGADGWFEIYNKKFAELVVLECADIGERYADGNYEVRNQILEHFGVEE